MRRLKHLSPPLALALTTCAIALAACGGKSVDCSTLGTAGTSGGGGMGGMQPPAETDDDFPLPLVDGLAAAPPMGWNSWNKFACNINADFVKQIADAIVSSGMKDAGYQYVNIDDCWSLAARAADGSLQWDPTRFPDGIPAIADYV